MKLIVRRYSGKCYGFEIDAFDMRYNEDNESCIEAWITPDSVVGEEKEGEKGQLRKRP